MANHLRWPEMQPLSIAQRPFNTTGAELYLVLKNMSFNVSLSVFHDHNAEDSENMLHGVLS